MLIFILCFSIFSPAQKQGAKSPPVPGPMLNQGIENYDTPDFTLSLVRSSQTIAALKPKGGDGFDFTPGEITLKKGEPVVLVLTSADVDHGVKFKELHVDVKAKKGQTSEVTFTPDQVGTFVGQCSVFCGSGHGSMKMILHVTE